MKAFDSKLSQKDLIDIINSAPLSEVKDKAFSLLDLHSLLEIDSHHVPAPQLYRIRAASKLSEYYKAEVDKLDQLEKAEKFLAINRKFTAYIDKDRLRKKDS